MKRAPKNLDENKKWQEALNVSYMLNGLVCIQHFKDTDLKPATKTRPVELRPSAVPFISEALNLSNDSNENNIIETVETTETSCQCNPSCKSCDRLKIDCGKLQTLRTTHMNLIARHDIEVAQFQAKIRRLETQLADLRCSRKAEWMNSKRNQNSKKKIKETLKQMQKENLLNQNVVDFVEVLIVLIVIIP